MRILESKICVNKFRIHVLNIKIYYYCFFFQLTILRFNTVFRMAGDSADASQLKGLAKYFNSQTNAGRANVSYLMNLKKSFIG